MIKERNTKQKTLILSAVRESCKHPTAEQVHAGLAPEFPGLSLGTVYRNLNRLAELGTIRRISVTNSPDRFDGNMTPHNHICCLNCGEFADDFDTPYSDELDAQISERFGYEISRHETVFYGTCPKCKIIKIN